MTNSQTTVNSRTKAYDSKPILWDQALIQRYDLSGPRYTSYPTAPQFKDQFHLSDWYDSLARSNLTDKPLSLYFHIPFCAAVCYYCGCNKVITANKARSAPYLTAIKKEVALQAQYADQSKPVLQLHWGGGTPTYLSDKQMQDLMTHTQKHFRLLSDDSGEYSIEIHPQTVSPERLKTLRKLGFNRLSIGVQDFNPDVQKAVNRFNSEKEVLALLKASKQLDYSSVSMDLIYGLPKQTCTSFMQSLETVINMRPDRLSLFNYAHMPHLFKVQNQINAIDLPESQTKLQMLHNSINQLLDAGYEYIGMDHFALPTDELAKAQKAGTLHRNFQGYSTYGNCELLAFGVSAINAINNTYAQNHKNINDYMHAIEQGQLPITRGYTLSPDDIIRRYIINTLTCQFEIDFQEFSAIWGLDFCQYFNKELTELEPLARDGLVTIGTDSLKVQETGRLLVRRVCMVFDIYFKKQIQSTSDTNVKYSRII